MLVMISGISHLLGKHQHILDLWKTAFYFRALPSIKVCSPRFRVGIASAIHTPLISSSTMVVLLDQYEIIITERLFIDDVPRLCKFLRSISERSEEHANISEMIITDNSLSQTLSSGIVLPLTNDLMAMNEKELKCFLLLQQSGE